MSGIERVAQASENRPDHDTARKVCEHWVTFRDLFGHTLWGIVGYSCKLSSPLSMRPFKDFNGSIVPDLNKSPIVKECSLVRGIYLDWSYSPVCFQNTFGMHDFRHLASMLSSILLSILLTFSRHHLRQILTPSSLLRRPIPKS